MYKFNKVKFYESNKSSAIHTLISFIDIEVEEYSIQDIVNFLTHSLVGDKLELTDHFIIKESEFEVVILNETNEMFVKNPENYRAKVEIESLIYLMNEKMLYGLSKVKSTMKIK
ncbi:hypothetical protein ABIE27_000759 [Paenibacillus sp. 4624]|uniref:hypothetical protein n=1 Tax=Paenibacillus sp. 4624 TaxID=3156453 RepID=UPI003D22FF8E